MDCRDSDISDVKCFEQCRDKDKEIDFEFADGYYDEWGDYHKKTGYEMFDFDEDNTDPDDDEELDTILINEINEDTMDEFGFGDDE